MASSQSMRDASRNNVDTTRRISSNETGPPVNSPYPANLQALMAFGAGRARRGGIPFLIPANIGVGVLPEPSGANNSDEAASANDVGNESSTSMKNVTDCPMDMPDHENWISAFQEYLKSLDNTKKPPAWPLKLSSLQNPVYSTCLKKLSCRMCGRFIYKNMYACFLNSHIFCGACVGDLDVDSKGRIFGTCAADGGQNHFRKLNSGFLDHCTFMCQYEGFGCVNAIEESSYQNHVWSCTKAWCCFLCSDLISPQKLSEHFEVPGRKSHSKFSLLLSMNPEAVEAKASLTLEISIPYYTDWAVGVFSVDGIGLFYLYQAKIKECTTTWFVIFHGTKEQAERLEVDIKLSARSSSSQVEKTFVYRWINKVFPWKSSFMNSVEDVMNSDLYHRKTATFNYKLLSEHLGHHNFKCGLSFQVRAIPDGKRCWDGLVSCSEIPPEVDELDDIMIS